MFCALNGATETPRRASARQSPVTTSDLPASEDVPAIRIPGAARHPFNLVWLALRYPTAKLVPPTPKGATVASAAAKVRNRTSR